MKKVLVWMMTLCLLCGLVQESALMARASEDDYGYESGGVQEEEGLTVTGNDAVVDANDTTVGSDVEMPAAVDEELDISDTAVSSGDNNPAGTEEILYETVDISDMVYQAGGWGVPAKEDEPAAITLYATSPEEELKSAMLAALQDKAETLDVSKYGYIRGNNGAESIMELLAEVINKNPELIYASSGFRYSYDSSTQIITTIIFEYNNFSDAQIAAFNKKLDEVAALVNGMASNEQKALVLHDYLAQHCFYAYTEYLTESKGGPKLKDTVPNVYNAYGALVDGKAVCQGYALAYSALLKKVGIDADICTSEPMNHAWNVIYIDNEWYHVDVTWDDPTWNREGRATHSYFLLSDNAMIEEWKEAQKLGKEAGHHDWVDKVECSSTKYDNYWWSDVQSQIALVNGNYYYIKNYDVIYINLYKRNSTGTTDAEELIWTGDNSTGFNKWPVVDQPGYYYSPYAFLSKEGDYLYFNDSLNLYYMKVTDSVPRIAFTYNNEYDEYVEGRYVYGAMVYEEGTARLNLFSDSKASDAISDEYHIITFTLPGRVTSVTLDKSTLALKEGGTEKLEATVEPLDAEDSNVSWSSDNEDVATVDADGTVTAHKSGEATITVKTNDGDKTATCTVTVTCALNNLVKTDAIAPTCEEDGNIDYWKCKECGKVYGDSAGSKIINKADVVIKATGHTSDNIWHNGAENSENHWNECSVCHKAINVEEHSFTDYIRDKEPTCTEKGSESRTCTVCKWVETKEVDATGHVWGDAKFTWAMDYSSATVVAICKNDPNHTEEASDNVEVTEKTINPTCTEDRKIIYTATATLQDGTVLTDEKTVAEEGTATGHDWGEAVIEWAEDYSSAKVIETCNNNPDHVYDLSEEGVTVTITEERIPATCTEAEVITYTAKASLQDGTELSDAKTVEGAGALGHEFSRYVLRNDGNTSYTYVMCIRCDAIDEKATEIQAAVDSGNVKVDVSDLDLSKIVGDSVQQLIQVVLDLDEAKEESIKKLEEKVSGGYKAINFIDVRLLLIAGSVSDGDSDLPELTENFGTVGLSLPVGIEHMGKNVIVYQLHGDEVITHQGLTVDGEGYISIKIDRLSVFAIAVQEEAENAGGDKEPQVPPYVPGTQLQGVGDNSDTQATQPKSGSSVPKTGDDSNLTLWISLLAAMVLTLSSLLLYSRKKFSGR